jgi:hypothetical protein
VTFDDLIERARVFNAVIRSRLGRPGTGSVVLIWVDPADLVWAAPYGTPIPTSNADRGPAWVQVEAPEPGDLRRERSRSTVSPALGWQPGLDVEVETLPSGQYRWGLYHRADLLASGTARTRVGLAIAVRIALWRHHK